jgi:hypothetical protein
MDEPEPIKTGKLMDELESMKTGKFFSGEMFDLTATSFNNEHGDAHNKAVMAHGINLPLIKFINELKKIKATTSDDKSDKRDIRLKFLISCNECPEVAILFILYCNYLNGGGSGSSQEHWANEQYKNFMVITAAGGNIVILFAHLIANMIDSFTKIVNTKTIGDDPDWKWNIQSTEPVYERQTFLSDIEHTNAFELFPKSFDELNENIDYLSILRKTFKLLTPINQLLLQVFTTTIQPQNTKEQLCFIIVKYFIKANETDKEILENLYNVAQSKISDFDFKLSPNIHPSFLKDSTYGSLVDTIEKLGLNTKDPGHAGFLLLRVKTLIDCSTDYRPGYTTLQLKQFQRDCASNSPLGSKIWGLFPQIMQESYLSDVPVDSECWLYLNYLWQKKNAISLATRFTIDEIMKFYISGYYKQSSPQGDIFPLVPSAVNSTEAVINYIANTTSHLNEYIEKWEAINVYTDDTGNTIREHVLSASGAPALNLGGFTWWPRNFSYESCCGNFKSLETILYQDGGLVSRLACDIVNYFLNNPYFNTENILDGLIASFNEKKTELSGQPSNAIMNPSNVTLAPTHKDFNASLSNIRDIFKSSQTSMLGYPDGIRITVNAIKSETTTGDTQLDAVESTALEESNSTEINSFYIHLQQKQKKTTQAQGQGIGVLKSSLVQKSRVQNLRVQNLRVQKLRVQKLRVQKERVKRRKLKTKKHKKSKKRKKSNKNRNSKKLRRQFTKKYITPIKI